MRYAVTIATNAAAAGASSQRSESGTTSAAVAAESATRIRSSGRRIDSSRSGERAISRARWICRPKSVATASIQPSVAARENRPNAGAERRLAAMSRTAKVAALPSASDAVL